MKWKPILKKIPLIIAIVIVILIIAYIFRHWLYHVKEREFTKKYIEKYMAVIDTIDPLKYETKFAGSAKELFRNTAIHHGYRGTILSIPFDIHVLLRTDFLAELERIKIGKA